MSECVESKRTRGRLRETNAPSSFTAMVDASVGTSTNDPARICGIFPPSRGRMVGAQACVYQEAVDGSRRQLEASVGEADGNGGRAVVVGAAAYQGGSGAAYLGRGRGYVAVRVVCVVVEVVKVVVEARNSDLQWRMTSVYVWRGGYQMNLGACDSCPVGKRGAEFEVWKSKVQVLVA